METPKNNKTQTFKEYYNSNPEFKKRHLEKMKTKLTCECGRVVNKAHMCKHLRSSVHIKSLNITKSNTESGDKHVEFQKQIDDLKELLEKLICN
jgi:hypothetical protein